MFSVDEKSVEEKKNWFLRHKIITGIILFFLLLIMIGMCVPSETETIKETKYQCADNTFVTNPEDCPKVEPEIRETNQQLQTPTKPQETIQKESKGVALVSKSFDDFSIKCDLDATNLQKKDLFNTKFKNNYVEWTGIVSSISDSYGRYTIQVRHCPSTWTSDIIVTMKDNQKDKLLNYKEGDSITYRAKLTRLGDLLGLSATDGKVVE